MEQTLEMNAQKLFDSYAENYDEDFLNNPLAMEQRLRVYREIGGYLQRSKSLLDVGCGPGADFEFYSKFNLSVDAIDVSPKMVKKARREQARTGLNARVLHASLFAFSPAESYDFILLNFGVINAIADLAGALAKLRTWLAPAGILTIVSMPPLHLAWTLENLARLQLKAVFRRLFRKTALLPSGMEIHYYHAPDFSKKFRLLKSVSLGAALPTPRQYRRWRLAQELAGLLSPLDRFLSRISSDVAGGDHVCYLLTHRKSKGTAYE